MEDYLQKLLEESKLIELKPVYSSNISAIGYDENKKLLKVMFKGGSKYLYENVEKEVYVTIINSESIGKTLNECIIRQKEKYKFYRI